MKNNEWKLTIDDCVIKVYNALNRKQNRSIKLKKFDFVRHVWLIDDFTICFHRVNIEPSCSKPKQYNNSYIKVNVYEKETIKGVNIRIYLTTVRTDL